MPVQNQDSFLKIVQTAQHAATEVRSIFYTRLVRQRQYFGNLWLNCWKAWKVSRSTTTCRYDKCLLKYKNLIWHCQQRATFIYSTEMILYLILRYLGTDPCRRWLRPVRDWNPNDCHRLTELFTSMLVYLQTVQWTLLDEGELNPTEYGWENVAFEPSPIIRDLAPATDCILQYKRGKTGLGVSVDPSRLLQCIFENIPEVSSCH